MGSQVIEPKTEIRRSAGLSRLLATTAIISLCALVPTTRPAAAQAAAEVNAVRSFNIPAQPLASALNAFGRQAGLQVTLASSTSRGLTSRAVNGSYTPQQALAVMLEGAGLPFRITADRTVLVGRQTSANDAGTADDGSVVLDTIDVNTAGAPADRPFETPGSTNFISGQELERFPGLTAGSIFQGTPGVISGSSNNGAAIDPNIRGLQGMNRVATTIDGSQQSTSSYRGYFGVDNRTYVDPDLISGITVTKGPDGGVGGAIGGTIAMETLGVDDVLKPGDTYGVRLRAGLNSNGVSPVEGLSTPREGNSDTDNGNVSIAAAVATPNVDLVTAYVQRKNGNYFAGTRGDLTVEDVDGTQKRLSNYGYGQEVFNTSEDVTSGLLKATLRPADGHEVKLGYLHYENTFGEVTPLVVNVGAAPRQIPLSSVSVDQVTGKYTYNPENDLINFTINSYASKVDEETIYTVSRDSFVIPQATLSAGFNAANISLFDIASTPLTLRYGGSYTYESARPAGTSETTALQNVSPANGDRQISTLFLTAKWEPLSWLTLDGGLEYLNYNTDFRGEEVYTYTGPEYTGYSGSGISPSATVTVTPLPGWQLYAQYVTGIRPPSIREVSQTRWDQVFNPDLVAEEARNIEFGTNLLKDGLLFPGDKARLKLAYFDNKTDNYIGRTFEGGAYMTLFNYDYVNFKGFELSGGYDVNWAFVDFGFNYYTDFKACKKDGECMDYTMQADYLTNQMPPRFTASVTAGMRFWDDRVTVGGRLTYMGHRLAPSVEDSSYFWVTKLWAPYTVVDLFGQWKINDTLTLDVGVQNLFDAYYVDALNSTDMPAPGRVIRGSLTAKLGGSEPVPWLPLGQSASARTMPWTGVYLGGHLGYGLGRIDGSTTAANGTADAVTASETADQSLASILGGAQAGYNYQLPNGVVLGIEGAFSWTKLSDYQAISATSAEGAEAVTRDLLQAAMNYKVDWLATVRGRAGYAFDRLLVYGTGGVAFMKERDERTQFITTSLTANNPSFNEVATNTRVGWTIGAGAEYAFGDHWSVSSEYSYAGFGASDFVYPNARAGASDGFSVTTTCRTCTPQRVTTVYPDLYSVNNGRKASNEADLHMFKLGVNYRF